jgi:hypothetical protein
MFNKAQQQRKQAPISEGDACETDHVVIPAQPPVVPNTTTSRGRPWVGPAGVAGVTEDESRLNRFRA